MKRTMKTLSMMMVIVLVLSLMSITAYADNNTLSITSDTDNHTYQIYQIFDGDYSETPGGDSILSNVTWGTGVNGAGLLAALDASAYGADFDTSMSAAEAADAIAGVTASGFGADLADMVAANLTASPTASINTGVLTAGKYVYTATGLDDGYYFVNEASFGGTVDNAYTKFILQVMGNVSVTAKTDKPAVMKKVLENNDAAHHDTWNDAADYNIGDNVPYRDVGLIPSMEFFDTYSYTLTDNIESGSTFNPSSVKVYLANGTDMLDVATDTATGAGGVDVTSSFTVTPTAGGFTVSVNDLKSVPGVDTNGYVVVEYTAELNDTADIGNPGNPSEVYLTYSNNPNDTAGRGETPKDEVVVYTFTLPIEKVDDVTPTPGALTDATFAVFTSSSAADAAVADPTVLTGALTFSGSAGDYTLDSSGSVNTLASDASGEYALKGLDQGTYYLVEIDEPAGYNRLSAAVQVDIVPTYNDSNYVNAHVPDATNDQLTSVSINGGNVVTVVNEKGSLLPETGGIGTTIFTVLGGILMLGALVLLITRKKVEAQK